MAGVKSDTSVWKRIRAALEKADHAHVKVGVLASKGGDAQHDAESGLSMVDLAAVHEFGAPAAGVPERSFIRRTFAERENELAEITGKLANKVVERGFPVERALDVLGAWGAAEVKKTVTAGPHIPPPLKPKTVERKGSDRPLVDTGRLVDSVTWQVDMGEG